MHNGQVITLGATQATIIQADLGRGGQGAVHLAEPATAPELPGILKQLEPKPGVVERVVGLCDGDFGQYSPYIAAPFTHGVDDHGNLLHLAPYFEGVALDNDQPRSLPDLLAIMHHAACQFCILHEHCVAHGDIAASNVLTDPDGVTCLIDLDCFVSPDPAVPAPLHIGQPLYMAPELRAGNVIPSIESDRFAFAVLVSQVLLGRHPLTDLAETPVETDRFMSLGLWPERQRTIASGETPIDALGPDLPSMFDAAFSLDPALRPSLEDWRVALHRAVNHCFLHDCGQALVVLPGVTECTWCGGAIQPPVAEHSLKLILPATGAKFRVELPERQPIIMGRDNLPGLPGTVSGRHLEMTRAGDRLLLHHIGRHPTLIQRNGQWYRLEQYWFHLKDLQGAPLILKVAEVDLQIGAA